jgi:glycosyltransferase involved in cell wall biosynthesis
MKRAGKVRVLEVIQQGEIGGGESHLLTLIGKMDTDRFEPVVIALSDGEMITRLNQLGIRNYVVSSRLPFNVSVWKTIKNILDRDNIDIVHTHGARALSNLIYPASRLSIPVVHTVHGWSFHDYLPAWKRRLRIAGERFLTRKARINIAVSESNKRIGIEELGSFNCEVINNGIDLSVYEAGSKKDIRKELNIPADVIVITFVARFIHDKNPLPLIKAFSNVHIRFPGIRLIMAGDGPARSTAIKLAADLGLADKIFFPGFRNDIPDILAASDIFCLPSIKEGLPVSLIEAMAMNNAVIATDVQGCVDVVTNQVDGILVPIEGLEQELTEALLKLISMPEERKRLAFNARKTVEQRFNAEVMARKIEDLYLGILTGRTGARVLKTN